MGFQKNIEGRGPTIKAACYTYNNGADIEECDQEH